MAGMAEWGRRRDANRSPLAKTSRVITPTEFREKNRLSAVLKDEKCRRNCKGFKRDLNIKPCSLLTKKCLLSYGRCKLIISVYSRLHQTYFLLAVQRII